MTGKPDLSNGDARSPLAVEVAWLSWLVVQNAFDLLHHVRREFLQKLQRLHVVVYLMCLRGAEDDGADVGVLNAPCEGELADVAADSLRDLCQL